MNKHGGYYGKNADTIIDFSVNINPLGISQRVIDYLTKSLNNLNKYPEINSRSSCKYISEKLGLKENEVILGNGAIELIYLYAMAIKPQKVMIIQPTFNEYERAVKLAGSEIIHFKRKEQDKFKLDIDSLVYELKKYKPDILIICNPNNPTGGLMEKKDLISILEVLEQLDSTLFLDESFIDFAPENSLHQLINIYPIFIIKSMTKYYAVPGIRLGYGIGNQEIIKKMNKYKIPWSVNSLAAGIVPIVMEDSNYHNKTMTWYRNEREYMGRELRKIDKITLYPSCANFYLIKIHEDIDLKGELLKRGIFIRDCTDFYGLNEKYYRIALKGHKDNIKLIKELRDILL